MNLELPTSKAQLPGTKTVLVCVVLVACAGVAMLGAQGQKPAADGVIRGRILAGDTGRPLRRAQLTLLTDQGAPPRNGSTNLEGRYEFKDLPAGRYILRVRRSGYLGLEYGQSRPGELPRPLQINPSQVADNVDFTLPRMSSITGRILDDGGEPMAGVIVWALRPIFVEGRRQLAIAAGGFEGTDDRGEYRMTGLTPGPYILRAMTRETWTMVVDGRRQLMGFAPTFHPGTAAATQARAIEVGVGQQVRATDLMMISARPATVSGFAIDSRGQPAAARLVSLGIRFLGAAGGGRGGGGMNVANQPPGPDGSFSFRNVPAGEYELTVSIGNVRTGAGETGRATVVVEGSDVENVRVVTTAGWTASGRIVTEEGAPPTFPSAQIRVTSDVLDDARQGNAATGTVRDDWTFTLTPILGRARLNALAPDGWMVKTIRREGRDISEQPIDLASGETLSDVEVVVTNRVTTVTGQLADDRGAPLPNGTVIVFADDRARWGVGSRFVRAVRPDQRGRWEVKGLPAGEYLATALDYVEELSWNDPAFLESLRIHAQRVLLGDGAAQSVSLKIVSP
jgi:hypothetical protein